MILFNIVYIYYAKIIYSEFLSWWYEWVLFLLQYVEVEQRSEFLYIAFFVFIFTNWINISRLTFDTLSSGRFEFPMTKGSVMILQSLCSDDGCQLFLILLLPFNMCSIFLIESLVTILHFKVSYLMHLLNTFHWNATFLLMKADVPSRIIYGLLLDYPKVYVRFV